MAASPSSVPRLMSSRSDVLPARPSPACNMPLYLGVMQIVHLPQLMCCHSCRRYATAVLDMKAVIHTACLFGCISIDAVLMLATSQDEFLRPALHVVSKQQLEQLCSIRIISTTCIRSYKARLASTWPSATAFLSFDGLARPGCKCRHCRRLS